MSKRELVQPGPRDKRHIRRASETRSMTREMSGAPLSRLAANRPARRYRADQKETQAPRLPAAQAPRAYVQRLQDAQRLIRSRTNPRLKVAEAVHFPRIP
jgi:hypothetical protein